MTTAYFILNEPTPELLACAVDFCMERYEAVPQGGVTFHGSTVYQAMIAPVPVSGLVGREARCNNDQCDLRERCQRWLCREDPWRHEAPRWRHGGETCDWKLLLPEDAPPTV